MNIIKKSVEISCTRILSKNNHGSILNISPTFFTPVSNVWFGNQFSTLEKGKIPSCFKTKNGNLPGTTLGLRKLHVKVEPAELVRLIAVTEDVSLQKLGFATKEEISKLSSDDIVNQINGEILRIFAVNSKSDIAAVETKEILAKLDSVFKVREDNQPHVDFPTWLLPMLELPDLKMWEVSRQAWMDRSPSKGWIVFKGYFDTLNRLKKEGDI